MGKGNAFFRMYPEDATGVDHHVFTSRNYVWNNDCGDTAGLWDGKVWIDAASYDPYPVEGKILTRQGTSSSKVQTAGNSARLYINGREHGKPNSIYPLV